MTTFEQALRTELMRSVRRPPRRRRATAAALVGGVAALAAALVSVASPGPAGADVEISRQEGRIEVVLTDLDASADEIRTALGDEDLSVVVEESPVGPSNVGRFVGDSGPTSDIENVEHLQPVGAAFMGFSLPEGWDGTLTVLLGRPAGRGEAYSIFSDAYAEGEPLACSDSRGHPLSDALDDLRGFDVSVRGTDGESIGPTDLSTALRDGLGSSIVTEGVALSNRDLLISVDAHPAEGPEPSAC